MVRLSNWPVLLNDVVEAWRNRPISYGDADCCQFVAECILAITGIDVRDSLPTYTNRAEAEAILEEYGGMMSFLASALGEPKPVAHAKRGDVVAIECSEGLAAAICLGVMCAVPGPNALTFRKTRDALAAWSI